MSKTPVIGSAHVIIRGLTEKLQSDIENAIDKAMSKAKTSGNGAGSSYREGFNKQVDGKLSTGLDGVEKAARNAGDKAGTSFVDGFKKHTNTSFDFPFATNSSLFFNHGRDGGRSFVDGVVDGIDSNGGGIRDAVKRVSGGSGGGLNSILFGDSGSANAGQGLRRAALQMDALVGVAGVVVGALASVASGLFAIGSAAAQATPSLIVLPAVLGALIQTGLGVALAFKGVGEAFKQGTAPATTSGAAAAAAAQRQVSAARAVERARRALADAYENAGERIERAQERVTNAEEDLTRAQERAKQAQEDINRAREEAIERLQDLDFAVRRGAIAEEEALLRLTEAQNDYFDAQNSSVDGATRKRRELDLKSAVLNLEVIRERNGDLAKEQAEAAKEGVEGSEEVTDAREREREAVESVADAQKNLLKAQKELTKTQRDSARDIADAQLRVAEAMEAQSAAMSGGAGSADKFALAMSKLTPAAQRFVRHLIAVRGEYKKVSDAAAEGLFDHLIVSSNMLISGGFLTTIASALKATTHEIGMTAEGLAKLTTEPFFKGNLQTVLDGNVRTTRDFGTATVALVGYLVALFAAADPLISRFTTWIVTLAESRRQSLDTGEEVGAMTEKFNHAGDIAAQLGRIIGNLWAGIKALAKAANPAGEGLLDSFEQATAKLRELNTEASQKKLAQYFEGVAANIRDVSSFLGDLGLSLLSLGDDQGIGETARILRDEFLPVLDRILKHGAEETGPALAKALVAIAKAFEKLSETGALEVFLGILEDFANIVTDLMENPVTRTLITWLVSFEAALGALALIRNFMGVGLLAGYIDRMMKSDKLKKAAGYIKSIVTGSAAAGAAEGAAGAAAAGGGAAAAGKGGILARMGGAVKSGLSKVPLIGGAIAGGMGAALLPVLAVVAAITALIGILVAAYKNSEAFRKVVDAAWKGIKDAVSIAWNNYILPALSAMAKFIGDVLAVTILWLWNYVIVPAFTAIGEVISWVWNNVIQPAFEAIGHFITEVVGPAFSWLWEKVIQPAFEGIGKVISFVWEKIIQPAFSALSFYINEILIPVITFLWKNVVEPAFKAISFAIQVAWAAIKLVFDIMVWTLRNVIGPAFSWLYNNIIKPIFSAVGSTISWVWNNVIKPVFDKLGSFISNTVAPAFSRGVDAIKTAWDRIRDIAMKPINFVIETVYTGGIKKVFDKIAQAVGSKTRMPSVSPIQARARGGYTPPGMTLVGEKGPELVNFDKSGWVYGASATKRLMSGKVLGGGLSWEGVTGAIAGARDWVMGNLRKAAKRLLDPVLELMNGVGGDGILGTTIRGVVRKAADMVLGYGDKHDKDTGDGSLGDKFTRGGGKRWPPAVMGRVSPNTAAAVMFLRKTFGITSLGTIGQRANKSDHPRGKAIDAMIPGWSKSTGIALGNRIAGYFVQHPEAFGTKYVIWRDKINTGSGWRPYVHPSGNTTNPTLRHMDHVHTSLFDSGGWLQPGIQMVENKSGRPEPVLTAKQWDELISATRGSSDQAGGRGLAPVTNNNWYVYNPVEEKTSQTVIRESTRVGSLGAF